ncbi:MAG: GldG family protein [bacterium]
MKIFDYKDRNKQFVITFITGAVLLGAIVILINMIFNNINIGRFDLTANNIYTISPSVKKIFSDLEAPIEATYYVSSSEKMPTEWKNLEQDVRDLLKELELSSNSMFSYKIFDPSKEEEKAALQGKKENEEDNSLLTPDESEEKITHERIAARLYEKGVMPFGVRSTNRDEFAIKRVYSSIVLSYLDRKEEVIAEVRPSTFGNLEYDIMSRIYKLITNKRPKIGFYPSQPEIPPEYRRYYQGQTPPDQYTDAVELLKQNGYSVIRTNIKEDDPIPEDIKTMILCLDQPLNERQLFEIDKLIHNGVHIIMAGQMFNYQISKSQKPGEFDLRGMPTRLNINELIKDYGFEIDDQMFMDKNTMYIQIPVYETKKMGVFQVQQQRYEPVTKPVLIKIDPNNINQSLSISNGVSSIAYMYGNRLMINKKIVEDNNLTYEILFTSSNRSWTQRPYGYNVNTSPPEPDQILKHEPLGIYVNGEFPVKYKDKKAPAWESNQNPGENKFEEGIADTTRITGEPEENKMILFGCSNLFKNNILASVASHKSLLLNSVDAFTLGEELINIRSKNFQARKISEVSAAGKAASKLFVVGFPIVIFILAGFYINIKRKNKRGVNS